MIAAIYAHIPTRCRREKLLRGPSAGARDSELGQLDALERTAAVVEDVAVTAELRALCAEWRALLAEDPPIAQQIVRRMLTERLTVERTPDGIRLSGRATFSPLVASIVLRGEMVPPG